MKTDNIRIWIDLDNSPHVPFFRPIINKLNKKGYSILLTIRDCFQVREMADLFNLKYKNVGRHYGKNRLIKVLGIIIRAFKILPYVIKFKPQLSLSHGSRSQLLLSNLLGIKSVLILDYEYAQFPFLLRPHWIIAPNHIPDESINLIKERILRYPGIKEDVYVPFFQPNPEIINKIGIDNKNILVTIRPPATEAHYHNPESEILLKEILDYLSTKKDIQIIILPRNQKQGFVLKNQWPNLFKNGMITIPSKVVDGLNLIWFSDLVISGGGTMNREAAALGVPVYSIFRGKIGAVDRYLSEQKRLVLISEIKEIKAKVNLKKRKIPNKNENTGLDALNTIVALVITILNK